MNIKIAGLVVLLGAGMVTGATAAKPRLDTGFRKELHWQRASTITIAIDRAHLLKGPSLEQIVAGAKTAKTAGQSAKQSQAVVQGEPIPLRYRRTIYRYFRLIGGTAPKSPNP